MGLKRASVLLVAATAAFFGWVFFTRSMPKGSWVHHVPGELWTPVIVVTLFNFIAALAVVGRSSAIQRADGRFYGRPRLGTRLAFSAGAGVLMALGVLLFVEDAQANYAVKVMAVCLQLLPAIGIAYLFGSYVAWDDEALTMVFFPFLKRTETWRDLQRVLDSGGGMPLGSVTLTFARGREIEVLKIYEGASDLAAYAARRLAENVERRMMEPQLIGREGVVKSDVKSRLVLLVAFSGFGAMYIWAGWEALSLAGTLADAQTLLYFGLGGALVVYGWLWWFRNIRWDDAGVRASNIWGRRLRYDWSDLEAVTKGAGENADKRVLVFSGERGVHVSLFSAGGAELIHFAESKLTHA